MNAEPVVAEPGTQRDLEEDAVGIAEPDKLRDPEEGIVAVAAVVEPRMPQDPFAEDISAEDSLPTLPDLDSPPDRNLELPDQVGRDLPNNR
jgi:hypothetical protein